MRDATFVSVGRNGCGSVWLMVFLLIVFLPHSSIGMAKAALNAIHGLNLFGGSVGTSSSLSVVHVDPDAQYRNHVILSTLLPRESSSRETDSSLLTITGFPAFCIESPGLQASTESRVESMLEGSRGFKRFPKDNHHVPMEGYNRRHSDVKVRDL